ncbi:hypothetical protein HMN09_00370900 [Mycena chlorophos]|uniref:Uncharacterized protein n=1 Tax=Mycena chlorophos TaxID=658473 RepID=A0A8H6TJC2_MYCCL|nr:hypothetical protein HMN09_00370900 [Mycena chlorophos]
MYPASYPASYPAPPRERRQWSAEEDELLRRAVDREEPGNPAPSKWHAIAQHVPKRSNKDCRKRWYAKMNSDVVKGGWAPDEDARLLQGINAYGPRWALVASMVQTRNSDQCAKRWCDTLNPAIDRTAWTASQDELLVQAVNEHGKVWTKIVQMYFPGRTGLAAKNRYNSVTRAETSSSRRSTTGRSSHSPDSTPSPSAELDLMDADLRDAMRLASASPSYDYSPVAYPNAPFGGNVMISSSGTSAYASVSGTGAGYFAAANTNPPTYPAQYHHHQFSQSPSSMYGNGSYTGAAAAQVYGTSGSRHTRAASGTSWAPY